LQTNLSAAAWAWPPKVIEMPEKPDLFKEELDQLSDQEIEARPAAAVWVDDKRAAVLRYLEEKKLGLKSEKLEIARSAKEAAWAAVEVAKDAQRTAKVALSIAGVAAAAIAAAALAAVLPI
jgi:hypothetical protein